MTSQGRLIGTSFGAGLVLTAAQLGVGGGLGLLDWRTPATYGNTLPWVAFIFTAATLGGVAAAKRRVAGAAALLAGGLPHASPLRTGLSRIAVTVAAGLGSLAMLPLVWMPVRAGVAGVGNAAGAVIGCAAAGVAVGMIFGVAALAAGPVAAGVAGSAAWLWAAALATAVLAAVRGGPTGARLGVVEAAGSTSQWWSGPYAMVGLYATLAFTVAIVAARFGAPRRQVALSGLVGPALLASAYAIAGSGGPVDAGSASGPVAAGPSVTGALGSATSASSGDVRIAVVVAAVAGLLASTAVAMRRTRSVAAAPAAGGPAVWPAEGSGAVVTTTAAAPTTVASTRTTTVDERPKKTRKARTTADPSAAPAVPAQRTATSRKPAAARTAASPKSTAPKSTSRKPRKAVPAVAPEVRPEPVAETREERRLEPTAERLSRREREHVKWMENLLNTPPDPTLTTRRSSS